jgi:hypothetical protein
VKQPKEMQTKTKPVIALAFLLATGFSLFSGQNPIYAPAAPLAESQQKVNARSEPPALNLGQLALADSKLGRKIVLSLLAPQFLNAPADGYKVGLSCQSLWHERRIDSQALCRNMPPAKF